MRQRLQGFRQQRHAAISRNQTEYRVSALHHLQNLGPESCAHTRVGDVPRRAGECLRGNAEEKIVRKAGQRDDGFAGGRMVFRQRGDKRARSDFSFAQAGGIGFVRKADESRVEPAFQNGAGLRQRREVEQVDSRFRKLRRETVPTTAAPRNGTSPKCSRGSTARCPVRRFCARHGWLARFVGEWLASRRGTPGPALVSWTPWRVRSSSVTPNSSSSWRICRLNAGCATCSFCAARVKFSSPATAAK